MLEHLMPNEFDAVFRLMELSFPPDERRTYDEQKALLQDPRYHIYTVRQHEEVTAFAAVWKFETFAFLEHLATAPQARNGGLGGQMLRELLTLSAGRACLEAELPTNELARRRIGFYTRNGFVQNPYPYFQPAITAGQGPVPLAILTAGRGISKDEFANLQNTLYTNVYRQKAANTIQKEEHYVS